MVEYLNFLTPHFRNCLQKYGCGVVEQRCFKKLRTADKKCNYADMQLQRKISLKSCGLLKKLRLEICGY
jgi:hypothetical protein